MYAKWFNVSATSWEGWFRVKTDAYNLSELEYRLGFTSSDYSSEANPSNGLFVRYRNNTGCSVSGSDGSTWRYESRNSGTSTTVNSGITVSLNTWYTFRIRKVGSNQIGFAGCSGSANCTFGTEEVITTNIPTASLVPYFQVVTCTAGYRKLNVDKFELLLTP
jgi:hypothetical protein